MAKQNTIPRMLITPAFKQDLQRTGLSTDALARAIGVTTKHFSDVWNCRAEPSPDFLCGAVSSGLAAHFGQVAFLNPATINAA